MIQNESSSPPYSDEKIQLFVRIHSPTGIERTSAVYGALKTLQTELGYCDIGLQI